MIEDNTEDNDAPQPDPIPDDVGAMMNFLLAQAEEGNAAALAVTRKGSSKSVYLLCVIQEHANGDTSMFPIAEFLYEDGKDYSELMLTRYNTPKGSTPVPTYVDPETGETTPYKKH